MSDRNLGNFAVILGGSFRGNRSWTGNIRSLAIMDVLVDLRCKTAGLCKYVNSVMPWLHVKYR